MMSRERKEDYKKDDCYMSEGNNENKEIITQESLQPKRIGKEEKAYQSVLDIEERLQKGDATNIALTGPYGSGKSSILITLKEDFPKHHYLKISLATLKPFDEKDNDEGDKPSKLNLDRLIEYSILQQLIYKEKQAALPNSRFKRIFQLPKKMVVWATIAIILAIIALIILFEPTKLQVAWLCKLFGKDWMNITGDTISILYLLFFAYKTISLIIPAISNSRLNKLNLKDGEIEIVENTSIFNKHLDEILYFFEQTEYDVVMLEDLDRFETSDIFLKLRELNLLLNESKVVNRTIFFVYAVRDDMFQDAERVKCFDYISTVIPVINRSNAKNQLKEALETRGVTEIVDTHLSELGFFLHDMRLLKNIANEYVQYRSKLEKGISCEKLLGMIVYKNYHPKDFADLHDCKGVVYSLLNLKEDFVSDRIARLESENERKRELQEKHQMERHLKESELRLIYLEEYRARLSYSLQNWKVGDSSYSTKDIAANDKLFEKLIGNSNLKYTYTERDYYNGLQTKQGTANIAFTDVEKSVNSDNTYHERLDALRTTFEELEKAEFIDIRKEDIRSQTLSQLMGSIEYGSNEKYKALEVPKLIEFLVVKGYIDENYYDYISYFYDNFVDAHDWDFVLDLKLGKTHPYDYHINNVESCLEDIPNSVYRKNAILNIDLLDFLAQNQTDRLNLARLLVILRTAVEGKKYDFLADYYQKGKCQDVVFEQLYKQHKNLWKAFESHDDDKLSLKLSWFKYAEKEQSSEASQKWLSKHFAFLTDHLLDIGEEDWVELIEDGNYEFEELTWANEKILKTVAETDSYTLTNQNVMVLASCLLDMSLDSVSYRLVKETECNEMIERIEGNLGSCLKNVFSAPESEKEGEETIIGILLSPKAKEDEKIAYLQKQQNKIWLDALEQKEVKSLALRCEVIEPTWASIIYYLNNVSEHVTDDVLVAFIQRHDDELAEQVVPQEPEDDERMLLRLLIKSNVLTFGTYSKIVNKFTRWNLTGISDVEERRVLLMIEKGMLHFQERNTEDLLNNYSGNAVVAYLLKNKREFLSEPEKVDYTTEVAIGLLKSGLSLTDKAAVIACFKKEILNEDLANEIIGILKVKEIGLAYEFLLKVMLLSNKTDEKMVVLNYTLEKNDFDEAAITALLNTLPGKLKEITEKGKKPELPDTPETKRLVELLKAKDYISSFSESKNGIRVNTKLK